MKVSFWGDFIADDLVFLAKAAEKHGYQVDIGASGNDVVVLFMIYPKDLGKEENVQKIIEFSDAGARVVVLVVSTGQSETRRFFKAGADDVVMVPRDETTASRLFAQIEAETK